MEHVILKGSGNGIVMLMAERTPFADLMEETKEKFEQYRDFLKGSKMSRIAVRGRNFSAAEQVRLLALIMDYLGEDAQVEFERAAVKEEVPKTYFHMGTVRSGSKIESDTDLVIVGDVNPGAEISAAGNVAVLGSLRGIVHAGRTGNRDAVIIALSLNPTQIRIAEIITRPPDGEESAASAPEIAYIRDGNIYVERLSEHK